MFNWISSLLSRSTAKPRSPSPSQLKAPTQLEGDVVDLIDYRTLAASAMAQNNLPEAIAQYRAALTQAPNEADLYRDLCLALFLSGHARLAKEIIEQGILHFPHMAELHYYKGNVCAHLNEIREAEHCFQQALAAQPEFVEAHFNLGTLYQQTARAEPAIACFRKVVELNPSFAAAHNNLGVACKELARFKDARECFERAIEVDAGFADAHNNLGTVLQEQSQLTAAISCFHRALALRPAFHDAQCNLGMALRNQNDLREAQEAFKGALASRPNFAEARWALAQTTIQILAVDAGDWSFFEQQSLQELAQLEQWCDQHAVDAGDINAYYPLFFLAGSDVNCKPILARYGQLCVKYAQRWYGKQSFSKPVVGKSGRIRIGIVSSDLREHPVWNALIKGWYRHLDQSIFEIHSFALGGKLDEHSEFARSSSHRFTDMSGEGLYTCVQNIVNCHADILLYPAIGSAMVVKLASLRLAPKQVATWGHPEGSGLPSIDYFISAEDFEIPQAQAHYAETLLRLPRLGCSYTPLPAENIEVDFAASGFDFSAPVLLCPGVPIKYAACNDHLLISIARELKQCKLIFFSAHPVENSDSLRNRLARGFTEAGLEFSEFVRFIPWQDRKTFFALMKCAHVFLDTVTYSGFNTAIQAVQCALPIVTKEGRFLRGRFASGILRRMGLKELVAGSDREYVELAVRLAQDATYRQRIKQRIREQAAALFDDPEASSDLNRILAEIAQPT